jgi:hypothetical protein
MVEAETGVKLAESALLLALKSDTSSMARKP